MMMMRHGNACSRAHPPDVLKPVSLVSSAFCKRPKKKRSFRVCSKPHMLNSQYLIFSSLIEAAYEYVFYFRSYHCHTHTHKKKKKKKITQSRPNVTLFKVVKTLFQVYLDVEVEEYGCEQDDRQLEPSSVRSYQNKTKKDC